MWRKIIAVGLLLGSFCCTVSAATPQMTMSVERQVYEYLTDEMGLPTSSACGVLANIEQESGFNVNAVGDHGTSYGLCQWHAGRFNALIVYCQGKGLDYETAQGQLEYLRHEMETSYSDLLAALRSLENTSGGAYRAAYLWCVEFERPANMEEKGIKRAVVAQGKYWNRYNSIELGLEEEELTQEEALEVVRRNEVSIPTAPEELQEQHDQDEQVEQNEQEHVPLMQPWIPRHRPKQPPDLNGALAFALTMLFRPHVYCKPERYVLPAPVWILLEEWELVRM